MKNPVTFGELLRRVEALEALTGTHVSRSELTALNDIAMERICDLEAATKPAEYPKLVEGQYIPHPAYAVAAEWKRKFDVARSEVRDKAERLSAVDADRERVRDERDEWRAKAEAHQRAVDTGETVGGQWLRAVMEPSYHSIMLERDALAAKVAELEHRLAEATNQRGICYVPLDELAVLRRDAERWRDLLALWRTGQILTAMRQLGNAIAPEQKGAGDVGD